MSRGVDFTSADRRRTDMLERIAARHDEVQWHYTEMLGLSRTRARLVAAAIAETDLTFTQIGAYLGISAEAVSQMNRRGKLLLGDTANVGAPAQDSQRAS